MRKNRRKGTKSMPYEGYTEKRKASNKAYMDKLKRCVVWVTPEEKKQIEDNAKNAGKSVNQYLKDLGLKGE